MLLKGLNIHTPEGILKYSSLTIAHGKIKALGEKSTGDILEFPATWHLIPGMIDMHIHGAYGADTMDASPKALQTISNFMAHEGTTAFLPTTMAAPCNDLTKVLKNISSNYNKVTGAEILGINLEGSFLSPDKAGAQKKQHLLIPDKKLFSKLQHAAKNLIKIVTIAPELPNSMEFISYLNEQNIIAAIGHTNADDEITKNAITMGATQATHIFNAMPPIHHRAPGATTALLMDKKITVELIADGIHLHPDIIKLIIKLKGNDKTILITDAIRATGLKDGNYELGGQNIIVNNNRAHLQDGTLAGSTLTLKKIIKNMRHFTHCPLKNIIKMTAENPAKKLDIFNKKGSISIGKDADLVVLNHNYEPKLTFCRGQLFKIL